MSNWTSNIPGLGRLLPAPTAPVTPEAPPVVLPPQVVVATLTAGAPTAGEWQAGQAVVDTNGVTWTCTVAGNPGTWARATATAGVNSFNGRTGNVTPAVDDYSILDISGIARGSGSTGAGTGATVQIVANHGLGATPTFWKFAASPSAGTIIELGGSASATQITTTYAAMTFPGVGGNITQADFASQTLTYEWVAIL